MTEAQRKVIRDTVDGLRDEARTLERLLEVDSTKDPGAPKAADESDQGAGGDPPPEGGGNPDH